MFDKEIIRFSIVKHTIFKKIFCNVMYNIGISILRKFVSSFHRTVKEKALQIRKL